MELLDNPLYSGDWDPSKLPGYIESELCVNVLWWELSTSSERVPDGTDEGPKRKGKGKGKKKEKKKKNDESEEKKKNGNMRIIKNNTK